MPGTNDNNQGNDNSVFNMDSQASTVVSPDQITMFADGAGQTADAVTWKEVPNSDGGGQSTLAAPTEAAAQDDGAVSPGLKLKILATLVIVGVAGYAAYWVQEPVQLRTDVLGSGTTATSDSTTSTPTDSTTSTPADSSTAAVADSTSTTTDATATDATATPSESVDVSLFGFNPATLTIDKGVTVIWTNSSTADQTIIGSAPDGESFASPVLTSGKSFSFKFDQDADFQYYSTYNPALKATIKVGLGSAAPADTTAADAAATSTSSTADTTSAPATDTSMNGVGGPDVAATTDTSIPIPTLYQPPVAETVATTTPTTTQLYPAASDQITPKRLSKTGPAEDLYAVILLGAAWINRKKLMKVFKK